MAQALIYAWDATAQEWKKAVVTAAGRLKIKSG